MSKTFIFIKNAFHLFCARTVIIKNSYHCLAFFYVYFLFEKMKLVISNHFNIVRLKTQSEKYMALKDIVSNLASLLEKK